MHIFRAAKEDSKLLRVYALKHCYEESRLIEKQKQKTPGVVSNCLIIRKEAIKNQTDFGYRQELKTNILRKMHFFYLKDTQDLIAFLLVHLQQPEVSFGMILVENIEDYFGDRFEYKECGRNFLIVYKLLKALSQRLKGRGKVCLSYAYNSRVFKKDNFTSFVRDEQDFDWQVGRGTLLKNGIICQNQNSKDFFSVYGQQVLID